MKIHELQPGDLVTEQHGQDTVAFEVVAIKQMGRRFAVTFSSALGLASAHYAGDAWISAIRG
ncbi:hypothetical protein [Chromobacterium sphagni]|uniref:Uncharacterized protein n=1 Tax=Chromobacterium sphagni TaxID=1903179 RepID=A0A1S1X5B8_9NEIS|nr:hypothetical protein [Chromobacterium sphagni]OHX14663.1 hypothetical protein BI347_14965 [Chromobacterium sphagni]OHX20015.1 hypothetical protein BI344_15555 [Chromobacterium sphagni]